MKKIFGAFLFALLLWASLYTIQAQASTAARGPIRRGEGAAAISGYEVSGVHYRLDQQAGWIDTVEFDLDAPASWAAVRFDRPSWVVFECESSDGIHWHCPLDGVQAIDVRQITISAGR
jgi:hypothetical protein